MWWEGNALRVCSVLQQQLHRVEVTVVSSKHQQGVAFLSR